MSVTVDVKQLLAAGAHFGHKTSRWHPKMAPYIHSKKGDIHIVDLIQTADKLDEALAFVGKTVASGKQVLFVGTKRQAKDVVQEAAENVDMPYVNQRWLGGMLTNHKTMNGRIKHLKKLEEQMAAGELEERYNKLEVQRFQEEIDRLNYIFGGVKDAQGLPGAVFVTDMLADDIAVAEARTLKIPVVAICDTNCDPTLADYIIPANDDAIKTLQLISDYVCQAIKEGKTQQKAAPAPKKVAADATADAEPGSQPQVAPATESPAKTAPAKKTTTQPTSKKATKATTKKES